MSGSTPRASVVVPLDEAQVRDTLRRVAERRVEAIAVCLLWSPANPAHEAALGRLIEAELPGVPYTLSSRLNPIIREYRRASSAAIDASLKPLMQSHLRDMEEDLRRAGFAGQLLVATSFGGVMHAADVVQRPIFLVKSGPAMAPVAGRTYGEAEVGPRDLIVCDAGGTSFDVSLVHDRTITFTRETWLGPIFTGHITGMASVDVRSIGAGGGSIAWIDPGGLLRVGPQSARAEPGPACYGTGGTEPTVTDAALVLGYIDPEYFLGGRMRLDSGAAASAVAKIASRLGLGVKDAARAIMEVAGDHMVGAIKDITINQGIDPRESLLVAGGGAAGLNILPIARELGCRQVLVPRTAGALSACGGQYSDIVSEFTQSRFAYTGDFPYEAVNRVLAEITASMERLEAELRERGLTRFKREYFVEARYPYQVWELDVALPKGSFDGQADLDATDRSVPSRARARFRGQGAGPAGRMRLLAGQVDRVARRPPAKQDGGARRRRCRRRGCGIRSFLPAMASSRRRAIMEKISRPGWWSRGPRSSTSRPPPSWSIRKAVRA